jgi:hypothetical protein
VREVTRRPAVIGEGRDMVLASLVGGVIDAWLALVKVPA